MLNSIEGARHPPAAKKTGRLRWDCQKAHERNGLPNTASDSSSTRIPPKSSPQYIKEMRTEYWVFCLPRPLPIPIFLPNVSILPYLLLISSYWRFLIKLQTRSHTLQAKVKMKAEQKLIRWTGNKTEWKRNPTKPTFDRRHKGGLFSSLLLLAKWRAKLHKSPPLFQGPQISSFLNYFDGLWQVLTVTPGMTQHVIYYECLLLHSNNNNNKMNDLSLSA